MKTYRTVISLWNGHGFMFDLKAPIQATSFHTAAAKAVRSAELMTKGRKVTKLKVVVEK